MSREVKRGMLSIVIPTKDRAHIVDDLLNSIVLQNTPQAEYEVIVIDNGSRDNTKQVIQKYQKLIKNLRYIYDARPGLHVGRNRGILESRGEYIGFLDDDVILFPNWINTVLEAFKDDKVMVVCGSVIPYDMSLITEEFRKKYVIENRNFCYAYPISCFWEKGISETDMRVHPARAGMYFGGNSVYKKKLLEECGGFHPDSMPKHLLMYRGDGETHVERYILKKRVKTLYCAQASVYHQIDVNRVNKKYIQYMFFRNGISNMYAGLRKNSYKGGLNSLVECIKLSNIFKSGMLHKLRGELYLFAYYIFYGRVRKWVHKENYF